MKVKTSRKYHKQDEALPTHLRGLSPASVIGRDFERYRTRRGDLFQIDGEVISFCCDEMEHAWQESFVGFGEIDRLANKNGDVNIYTCHPYPEGAAWEASAIKFCPFCAEAIEIVGEA